MVLEVKGLSIVIEEGSNEKGLYIYHATKAKRERIELQLYSFLTSAFDGVDNQRPKLTQQYCELQHRCENLKFSLSFYLLTTYGTIWHCPSVLKASYSSINHTIIH
jgi:hypothetical protein